MNLFQQSIAALGLTTVLLGMNPTVYALPAPTIITQKSANDFHKQGLDKAKQGDLQGALADLTQALQMNPKFASAYYNRGVIRTSLGEKQGAVEDYTQAIRLEPRYSAAFYNRGVMRSFLGDQQGAIQDYTQAISANQQWVDGSLARTYNN